MFEIIIQETINFLTLVYIIFGTLVGLSLLGLISYLIISVSKGDMNE